MSNQPGYVITNQSRNILADRIISYTPSGTIEFLSPVSFSVVPSVDITENSRVITFTAVSFTNPITNLINPTSLSGSLGSYDSPAGEWTAPEDGIYSITCYSQIPTVNTPGEDYASLIIFYNGASTAESELYRGGVSVLGGNFMTSIVRQLSAGDIIRISAAQSSGLSTFSGATVTQRICRVQ